MEDNKNDLRVLEELTGFNLNPRRNKSITDNNQCEPTYGLSITPGRFKNCQLTLKSIQDNENAHQLVANY